MNKIDRPIFIFCLHRSGSTYLKNIIDASDEVKMLEDEVNLDHPLFSNTFKKYYQKTCKNHYTNYDDFLNTLNNKELRGAFWNYFKKKYGDFKYSKKFLLEKSNLTVYESFNSILRMLLSQTNKSRIGVKYPTHFKYFEEFIRFYPDSKRIFLIRDIRAIVASKLLSPTNKRLNTKKGTLYELLRFVTVLLFSVEYLFYLKLISKNYSKGLIVKYEDLLLDNYNQIQIICSYTEISYNPKMQDADGQKSGYKGTSKNEDRINRWKGVLRNYEIKIINSITGKKRRIHGYE